MAEYNVLKAAIADYVKDRTGLSTIDGDGLQETLLSIVNSIGVGYVFMGVADLTTNPGNPDQRVWYLAATAGIYANFNNITLDQYEIAVLKWDTEWHKEVIPDIPSKSQIDERLDEQDAEIDRRMDAQDGRLDEQDARIDGQDEEISDFKEAVQNQVDNYPMITINGNVTNAPDEEDLTSVEENGNDVLKFKNRSAVDGMGYKILRKGTGLTFANQVTDANTIYEIRYDFDLAGGSVTIPHGCVLKFNGGKITNGMLDLNSDCDIIGSGINCEITNPSPKPIPLSCYLADASDPQRNNLVVQTLLDADVAIHNDIAQTIEFDDYISVKQRARIYGGVYSFPNSRGFVWDKKDASCHKSVFEEMTVSSLGNTFDFANNGDINRPANVYFNVFRNVSIASQVGDCITAGPDNLGSTGDSLSFCNYFENVFVTAPAGNGFVGLGSNTNEFIKCVNINCKTFFYNCTGVFDSCNGTFAQGNSDLFYKGRGRSGGGAFAGECIFRNCNIESYINGTIIDCNDALFFASFSFENCSLYVYKQPGKSEIDYFPINIGLLRSLELKRMLTFKNADYAQGYSLFRIANNEGDTINLHSDNEITYIDRNGNPWVVGDKNVPGAFIFNSGEQTRRIFDASASIKSGDIRVDRVDHKITDLLVTANNIRFSGNSFISLLTESDTASDPDATIRYFAMSSYDASTTLRSTGYHFYLRNGNQNRKFVLEHRGGYGTKFVCNNGASIVLSPGETARCIVNPSQTLCYVEKISFTDEIAERSGASRPSGVSVGFQFFDTSLGAAGKGMPIWYAGKDGSNNDVWVDATGASV